MKEEPYNVNVAALTPEDVRPRQMPGEEPLPSILLSAARLHRVITLESPRSGCREVRMLLAQAVFNLPDYHDLVVACEAAHRALRSGPTKDKDYTYELELLNKALR